MTLCHKLWFSNTNIFGTQCRKPLMLQTYIFWSNKSHSLKFLWFTTLESKDIGFRKSEFVAKTQFLSWIFKIITKIEFCWRLFLKFLSSINLPLWSCEVPHKIWARLVQPFSRLLNMICSQHYFLVWLAVYCQKLTL